MAGFVKLKSIIKQIRGVTYNQGDVSPSASLGYIPLLRATNIKEHNSIDKRDFVYVSQEKVKQDQYLQTGDILIAASSGSIDIVGKAALFDGKEVFTFGAFCKVIRPDTNIVNPKYVSFFFQTIYYRKRISFLAQGANINNLKNSDIDELDIFLPDIEIQNKVVTILEKVKNLTEKREQTIALCEKLLTATFIDMFGDPVTNDKKWESVQLSQLGSLDRGVSKNRPRNSPELLGGKYPLIQTSEVTNSNLYITKYSQTYSELGLKQSKLWNKGTLLITIAANIAKTSILTFDACFPDSIVGFVANENETNNIYVHYLFDFFQEILERNAPQSAQKNINLAVLRSMVVPKPPLELQSKFLSIVIKIERLKKGFSNSLCQLREFSNSLNKLAYNGELAFNTAVDLEVLMENDYDFFKANSNKTTMKLLLDRLDKDELNDKRFHESDLYVKAKNFIIELLNEGKVKQKYDKKSNKIKLVLQ